MLSPNGVALLTILSEHSFGTGTIPASLFRTFNARGIDDSTVATR
ncbi:MAG: hypothetical protein WDN49_02820 [Acetobacteraceae bacterium]